MELNMDTAIKDLVAMHDVDSLYQIMIAGDDDVQMMDAAEGLVQLGDKRGLKYLENALDSDDKDVRAMAKEILESAETQRMRAQIEADIEHQYQTRVVEAKVRVQKGKKVYRYKVIFIPAMDIMQEDFSGEGIDLPELEDAGLEGWEVVNLIPRRQLLFDINDQVSGAYAFLKKEVAPDETAKLDRNGGG
jgi:hypothetical protein